MGYRFLRGGNVAKTAGDSIRANWRDSLTFGFTTTQGRGFYPLK